MDLFIGCFSLNLGVKDSFLHDFAYCILSSNSSRDEKSAWFIVFFLPKVGLLY